MQVDLIVVGNERRVDSRDVAREISVKHDNLMQTINKYQSGLEKYGVILFQTGKRLKGGRGGRPEQYVLLNKEQFGYLLMFVRVTPKVREFREYVYDKFLEYEKQQQEIPNAPTGLLNSLWVARAQLFNKHTKLDADKFCVFRTTTLDFLELDIKGCGLPEQALPDGSIGKRWYAYARDILLFDMSLVTTYKHHYPDKRGVQDAYLYPIEWQPEFNKWFKRVYIPNHLPDYLNYLKVPQPDIQKIMSGFGVTYQIRAKKSK